jgi:dTDP-4-amino-4,6-dideoxygalactose transaminase
MSEALAANRLAGDGPFTKRCHQALSAATGGGRVLLTTSCTHALEMSALLLDITRDDEVICPAFTFVSSVNAFVLRGARPVFVDVRSDTLSLNERLLAAAITPRTKAIVVVHYAGVAAEMDSIMGIAARRGIAVVEDNAHGLFGAYRGRPLGSIGSLATLSFHETKNITCGEGGALIVNDTRLCERAEIIREKGTDRSRYFRGEIDKYTWVDVGSSYLPSDILAAYLWAQLQSVEAVQAARRQIWHRYATELAAWASNVGVQLPTVPAGCDQAYHMFYMLLPTLAARQSLMAQLKSRDIGTVFHYQPLHLSSMGRRFGGQLGQCPVSEHAADTLIRLPMFYGLPDADQTRVIEEVTSFVP